MLGRRRRRTFVNPMPSRPGGPRAQTLRQAAGDAGVAVLGGVIERDPATGRRRNTALLVDGRGDLVASYRKLHLPEEDGFHETKHYEPGDTPPEVIRTFVLPLGIQICSDTNRPLGTYRLAAQGAEAILIPRATEVATFDRWRLVFQANALISSAYVVSVSRPARRKYPARPILRPSGGVARTSSATPFRLPPTAYTVRRTPSRHRSNRPADS